MQRAAAAIAGSGATPYYFRGLSAPQTNYELIGKAILAACEDAGITVEAIDGIVSYANGFEAANIIEMLGIPELSYAVTVTGQGGGSAGVLDVAASAIESGRAKHVVCIGCSQQVGHRYGTSLASLATTPQAVFSLFAGLNGPGPSMALLARRHMHKYGTRREAFAEVVRASRDYALNMPGPLAPFLIGVTDFDVERSFTNNLLCLSKRSSRA